jgi:hypothetical protein
MDNDPVYQYLALFLENLSVWPVLIVGAVWWLVKHPALFEKLPDYFSRLKIGSVEVELRGQGEAGGDPAAGLRTGKRDRVRENAL